MRRALARMDGPLDPLLEAVLRVQRAERVVEMQRWRVQGCEAAGQADQAERARHLLEIYTERLALLRELLEWERRADKALRRAKDLFLIS